ncbi:DUF4870 family protein [Pectinatus sottacetonis]|uniref:DUF4870 family protein n=1 Tax=Pectinatus sottacetonis TaxID=1002795 RepID=UPI0018C817EB|nr:zinc ribbon domain-containing protein [Pectinatus sottacetonis]
MIYCPKCGAPLNDDACFCTKCGEKITKTELSNDLKENSYSDSSDSYIPVRNSSDKNLTLLVYVLHLLGVFFFITPFAAIIINYIKRDDMSGTWLESHFAWQIKTFWIGLLLGVVGAITSFFIIGLFILILDGIWLLYRNIKGILSLNENKPMDYTFF